MSLWTFALMSWSVLPVATSMIFSSPSWVGAPPPQASSLPSCEKASADDALGEAGQRLAQLARAGVPELDLLVAAAGDGLAVGAVGDRLDERQVGRRDRLAVGAP